MGIVVPVQNGQVVDGSAEGNSVSGAKGKDPGALDKEAFLQLLVAQMKYQDPLEPTSNTEYISQLATFSSLEEMQNLNATSQASQATQLVGKQVIMRSTSKSGETTYVTGRVDFIVRENGQTYLSINDGLYSIDDLDTVIDDEYLDAININNYFKQLVALLPSVKDVTASDKDKIEAARKAYDEMTDYEKTYVDKDSLEKLKALEEKLKELIGEPDDGEEEETPETPETPDTPDTP